LLLRLLPVSSASGETGIQIVLPETVRRGDAEMLSGQSENGEMQPESVHLLRRTQSVAGTLRGGARACPTSDGRRRACGV